MNYSNILFDKHWARFAQIANSPQPPGYITPARTQKHQQQITTNNNHLSSQILKTNENKNMF